MSEARQLFMEVSLAAQKQSFSEVEALNTFRGPQGQRGEPGSIDNLVINGKKAVPVDGKNTIDLTPEDMGALPSDGTATNANALNGKDADEYVLHSDALTLEEIKASTDLTGKIPDAASLKTMSDLIGTGKFGSLYDLKQNGITTPETWGGVIRVSGKNWGSTFVSDTYFFAITASGKPYVGVQTNGATDVTWTKITTG